MPKTKGEMPDDEKRTDPGLSGAERKTSECGRRKRRSPAVKKRSQHSMKVGSASAKNAGFERRPRGRCSLPLQNCRTIRRLNAYCFPPGSRTLSEQPT